MTNPKGATFERKIADHLGRVFDDPDIDRQIKTGSADKGDIRGLKMHGQKVVVECKNTTRLNLAGWVKETEIERGNADALAGIVVHKRSGHGDKKLGGTYVTMTLDDLVALLIGVRPDV
jgi:hypothetical protein